MATDTSKVFVPASPKVKGMIHRAPLGTPLPTTASEALDAAFVDLGGVSDAGITNAQARETVKIKDFDGKTIATPQSDYSETLQVEFVESMRLSVLKTVFGEDNVRVDTTSGDITVDHNATILERSVFVVDTVQGKGLRRLIAAIAKPDTVGDVVQVSNNIVKYQVTFETFEFLDEENETTFFVRELISDGVAGNGATSGN